MYLNKYSAEPFEFMSCLCKEKKESSNSQGLWRRKEGQAQGCTVGKLHLAQKINAVSGPSVGPTETRDLPGTQHSGTGTHRDLPGTEHSGTAPHHGV